MNDHYISEILWSKEFTAFIYISYYTLFSFKFFTLLQYQKVDTLSPFSDGKPRALRGQIPCPQMTQQVREETKNESSVPVLGHPAIILGMGGFQMELRSNPLSLVIKSGCFWGCIVLMTGWISLEWQGKMYWMSGSLTYLPSSTLAPQEIDMLCHCQWLWVSHRQEDDGVIGTVLFGCLAAFVVLQHSYLVCGTFFSFHSSLLCTCPSAGQSTSIYTSCPAVSLLTPICLMGRDEICVGAAFQGDEWDIHRVPGTVV